MRKFKILEYTPDGGKEVIVTEEEIINKYLPFWIAEMNKVGKAISNAQKEAVDDWVIVNWAEEIK